VRPLKADPTKDPTLDFERECCADGTIAGIIGLDEAGRGAIAGPVSVGAQFVARHTDMFPEGLRDSKLLSEARREWLYPNVEPWGSGAVGYGDADDIDRHGITTMLGEAARRALLALHDAGVDVKGSLIILDGSHDWLSPVLKSPLRIMTRVGADRAHASVAAASLRAKVLRDRHMLEAHTTHPYYAWDRNKGYGSEAHYAGINTHGVTTYHRTTWIKS